MAAKQILLPGNLQPYEVSEPVCPEELQDVRGLAYDLHDTLMECRNRYGAGRAIASPQLGAMKRVLHVRIDDVSTINPDPVDTE